MYFLLGGGIFSGRFSVLGLFDIHSSDNFFLGVVILLDCSGRGSCGV